MNFWLKSKSSTLLWFSLVLQCWPKVAAVLCVQPETPNWVCISLTERGAFPSLTSRCSMGVWGVEEELTELGVSLTEVRLCTRMHKRKLGVGVSQPASVNGCHGQPQGAVAWRKKCFCNHELKVSPTFPLRKFGGYFFSASCQAFAHINIISMTFTNSPACFLISRSLHWWYMCKVWPFHRKKHS